MRRFGKWVTVLAVTVLTLGALPATLGSSVAGAAAADIKVALFYDSTYGDLNPGGGGESFNLKGSLETAGYTVTTFSGLTAAGWTAALAGQQVLAIPELQTAGLETAREPAAVTAIHNFVNAGGRLMMFDRAPITAAFLNAVFGFSIAGSGGSCPCTLDATAAAGTEFAGGVASLPNMKATETFSIASLPVGSKAIYVDDVNTDSSAVTLIPFGAGSIVHIAWDWYFDGTQTADFPLWTGVVVAGVNAAAPAPAPVPTPEPTPEPLPAFTG